MPITPFLQRSRGHKWDTCNDHVVGAILSGWRYDISSVPKDLRGDYEAHLEECAHCQKRQRLHRTIDFLLLATFTLALAVFLLVALLIHRVEAYTHIQAMHVPLHAAMETHPALARIPASITLSLEAVALCGVAISLVLSLLVALATPAPTLLSDMFRQRYSHERREEDELKKQAA